MGNSESFLEAAIEGAIRKGDAQGLCKIIDDGYNIDSILPGPKLTALQMAAYVGHLSVVMELVSRGANTTITNEDNLTAMHLALLSKHFEVASFFLEHDPKVSTYLNWCEVHNKWVPLHMAVLAGDIEITKLMLEKGALVNFTDSHQRTALHMAAAEGNLQLVHLLLLHHADVHVRDEDGRSPLHLAAATAASSSCSSSSSSSQDMQMEKPPVVKPHTGYEIDGHAEPVTGPCPIEVMEELLKSGADPNAVDDAHHQTPLHIVTAHAHAHAHARSLAALRVLLSAHAHHGDGHHGHDHHHGGADPNAVDAHGLTPVHYASHHGHADLVKALLDAGADVQHLAGAASNASAASASSAVDGKSISIACGRSRVKSISSSYASSSTSAAGRAAAHAAAAASSSSSSAASSAASSPTKKVSTSPHH